jgi:hypothetical protein
MTRKPDWSVRCTATRRNGEPCRSWAIRGGNVCRKHGGGAPQVRAKANRRLRAKELATHTGRRGKGFDKLIRALEVDAADRGPTEILLDVVYRAYAMVQLFGAIVGKLELPREGEPATEVLATDGLPALGTDLYGPDHHGDGKPHVAVVLYQEALTRAAQASKLALDAGVSERLVRVEQEKGRLIAQLINAVIDDPELGLSEGQRATARSKAAGHLRLVAGD